MAVVLLGNCQIAGLARCMRVMNPSLEVRAFTFPGPASQRQLVEDCVRASEITFVQTARALAAFREFRAALAPRVIVFPRVYFAAYHPDILYVRSGDHLVETPLGHYNSKIVLAGYLQGLSVEATVALFDESVFRRLGYLEAWDASVALLRREIAESDVKLDDVPAKWTGCGAFMYSVNHPRLRVLGDVARAMLRTARLAARTSNPETYLHDELKTAVIWPIYPAIAATHGIGGDYCFKVPTTGAEPATLSHSPSTKGIRHGRFNRIPSISRHSVNGCLRSRLAATVRCHGWLRQARRVKGRSTA